MENLFVALYERASRDESNEPFPTYLQLFFPPEILLDWLFHSAIICGPDLCKQDGMMKTRLATNTEIGIVVVISLLQW